MPEVEYTTEIAATPEEVWAYVENLESWAPFVIGFQKLQIIDERQSIWSLRGDVGILSREVDLRADITLWEEPRRAEFTVTGITERIDGSGSFTLEAIGAATPEATAAGREAGPTPRRPGFFRRVRTSFARFVLRRLDKGRSSAPGPVSEAGAGPSRGVESNPGPAGVRTPLGPGEGSRFTFTLRVSPGGPMAPMLEVLMEPMLEPAAEDVATRIRDAIER